MIRPKSKDEIKIMREGGKILAQILDSISQKVAPGANTGELEELTIDLIKQAGGRPAQKEYRMPDGKIFPSALCTSINEEIVHAPALPSRELKFGDIVSLDFVMEYPLDLKGESRNRYSKLGGYYTDSSRTAAVGEVSNEVKKLLNIAKECLDLAITKVKPGNNLDDIGSLIQDHAEGSGFAVVRELVGHGVGYDVHEDPQVPNYRIKGSGLENVTLQPGMVFAIEPMITMGGWKVKIAKDGFSLVTLDKSLSAHFEHTVAVTDDGCLVLTAV